MYLSFKRNGWSMLYYYFNLIRSFPQNVIALKFSYYGECWAENKVKLQSCLQVQDRHFMFKGKSFPSDNIASGGLITYKSGTPSHQLIGLFNHAQSIYLSLGYNTTHIDVELLIVTTCAYVVEAKDSFIDFWIYPSPTFLCALE